MDTNVYEVIFPLLRSALWGEEKFPFTCPDNVDWEEVNKELRAHTIQYLPTNILSRVNHKNCIQYYQNTAVALRSWNHIMQEQQNLYALLQKENLPFAILKGAAADIYYPEPIYRCMGDIDFIVKPEDFDRTAKCLEENGYELIGQENPRHVEFKKNGIDIELHRSFCVLEDDTSALWLDQLFFNAIDHAVIDSLNQYTFPLFSPLENGLVLLAHLNHHIEGGLGLRQVIDWMLYVDCEVTDDFWNTSLGPASEHVGLKTLAITVTKMCQVYLGLTKKLEFIQEADVTLCDDLMQHIIELGNFGSKRGRSHNASIGLFTASDLLSLFRILQIRGEKNWKILYKHPFLKPFSWMYQLVSYCHKGLKREKPLVQLKEEYMKSKIQDNLMDRLEVTRRERKRIKKNP